MSDAPLISRVLVIENLKDESYGVEIIFDNPTLDTVWIDQIQFLGEVDQFIQFSMNRPFFHALTYYIQMTCDLVVASEYKSEYALDAYIVEDKSSDWAYNANGEFNFEFPGGGGRRWDYSIRFPVILSIVSKGRSAIRLLFGSLSKSIVKEKHKGGSPNGMYTAFTDINCKIIASTTTGLTLAKEMDGSFLEFVANNGKEVKQRSQKPWSSLLKQKKVNDNHTNPDSKMTVNPFPILLLTADPTNASRLRVGQELREIQEKLQLAKLRDKFVLHQGMSVRPADISQALLDIKPRIVHFSGHGQSDGTLCFEDQTGEIKPVKGDALAALFEQFRDQVDCILLNACYSENQAIAIAEHINYVIGMNAAIGDEAAIAFSIGFYQGLGGNRTIEEAYKLGCIQIRLQGIPEHLTPVLVQKK